MPEVDKTGNGFMVAITAVLEEEMQPVMVSLDPT
jgi:hypothetical protein